VHVKTIWCLSRPQATLISAGPVGAANDPTRRLVKAAVVVEM